MKTIRLSHTGANHVGPDFFGTEFRTRKSTHSERERERDEDAWKQWRTQADPPNTRFTICLFVQSVFDGTLDVVVRVWFLCMREPHRLCSQLENVKLIFGLYMYIIIILCCCSFGV